MRNVNSAKLHELATELRQGKSMTGPTAVTTMAVAASAVSTLAAIHEVLSDEEFSADTCSVLSALFVQHGLPLFNRDEACDIGELRTKYGEHGHPSHPVKAWKTAVHCDDTTMGYWEWVDLQLSMGDRA